MEKIILLILISLCLNPAWGAEFTIGQDSELILDQGGVLRALPRMLPPGSVVEVDDSVLSSVESQGRTYQQRYTNNQGHTGLSEGPLVPKIKIISVPEGFGYNLDSLTQYEFYMNSRSLRPQSPSTSADLESERVSNFLGVEPSEVQIVQSTDQELAENQVTDPYESIAPMISQPRVEVTPASYEISETARKELYPPLCGCVDCHLMTAHKESSCNALEESANECSQNSEDTNDGNKWLAPANLPIHAPCAGEVVFFGETDRYGRQLVLACEIEGRNYHFRFNHLNAVTSKLKDTRQVTKGQAIAIVGDTGTNQGYHLAHQIHVVQDPKIYDDPTNTFRDPKLNPNVLESIDPSYFYTKIASTELGPESEQTSEYRSQILERDCPVIEQSAATTSTSPSSDASQAVQ